MKLYNIFKPHLVTDGERYAIRSRKGIFYWQYYDLKHNFWWMSEEYVQSYCWTHDKSVANSRFSFLTTKVRRVDP